WPSFARWGLEALLVAALMFAAAFVVPWDKLFTWTPKKMRDVVLTEVSHERAGGANPQTGPAIVAQSTPGETQGVQTPLATTPVEGPVYGPAKPADYKEPMPADEPQIKRAEVQQQKLEEDDEPVKGHKPAKKSS